MEVPVWPGNTTEHSIGGALIRTSVISASVNPLIGNRRVGEPLTANFAAA
jgi:hypothetical protein